MKIYAFLDALKVEQAFAIATRSPAAPKLSKPVRHGTKLQNVWQPIVFCMIWHPGTPFFAVRPAEFVYWVCCCYSRNLQLSVGILFSWSSVPALLPMTPGPGDMVLPVHPARVPNHCFTKTKNMFLVALFCIDTSCFA